MGLMGLMGPMGPMKDRVGGVVNLGLCGAKKWNTQG